MRHEGGKHKITRKGTPARLILCATVPLVAVLLASCGPATNQTTGSNVPASKSGNAATSANPTTKAGAQPKDSSATVVAPYAQGTGVWAGHEYFGSKSEALSALNSNRICELVDTHLVQKFIPQGGVLQPARVEESDTGYTCRMSITMPVIGANSGEIVLRGGVKVVFSAAQTGLYKQYKCEEGYTSGNHNIGSTVQCTMDGVTFNVGFTLLIPNEQQVVDGRRGQAQLLAIQILSRLDGTEAKAIHSSSPP